MSKRRVLYIGSGTPWLGGAGYLVRQNLFLGALAELADLHLAMFDADPAAWPPFSCQFTALSLPRRSGRNRLRLLAGDLVSSTPRMLRGYDLSGPHRAVAALSPDAFDAVFAYRIDFAYFAGVLHHPRLLLDIDDPEHVRAARRLRTIVGSDGDWRTRRDLQKLKEFENLAVARARMAFVCQENDRRGWTREPQVVPNCVEVPLAPQRKPADPPRLLFVGNCAGNEQAPNVDGVKFFLTDIWPLVHRAVPAAQFHIVGAAGDTVRQLAAGKPNVQVVGFVPDLAEAYAAAAASVAPIRFGTGTRIKILESFAYACPVVSTLAGAEGIDAVPGKEIELAVTAQEFADHCVHLLTDLHAGRAIGVGGYRVAASRYDRKVQHAQVVSLLRNYFDDAAPAPLA